MSKQLMQHLASMAERRPLRALYILCDGQKQVSTGKLRDYLDHAGDTLAGYAATLRHEFDRLAAAPAAPVVQSGPAVQKILDLILGECKYWHHRDEARRGGFAALYAKAKEVADAAPPAQPDAALVEALRNMLAAFDNPIARRKLGSEFNRQAIESAHDALAGKGGE